MMLKIMPLEEKIMKNIKKSMSIFLAIVMTFSILTLTVNATTLDIAEKDEECSHNYNSVVTAPTCTKYGYTSFICSSCNDTYYKDIVPATGHNYESTVVAPTCTEQGYTKYTCACGDTYIDEYVDATGHRPLISAYVNTIPATCIKKGSYDIVTYCIDCNTEINRVTERTPATGHNYINGKCENCGVEDVYYYNGTFRIETPSRTEIRHRDGIKLHAKMDGTAPSGCYIVWTADNDKFATTKLDNGKTLKIVSEKRGTTVFTATLYSNEGVVLDSDSIEMESKAGLFQRIGSFFRSIFNTTKLYEN